MTTGIIQLQSAGIDLTPLIALIYISVEPAVTQNCVASVTNKQTKHPIIVSFLRQIYGLLVCFCYVWRAGGTGGKIWKIITYTPRLLDRSE